jgi:pyridinium-3,5-biscarboxylic acid mononucleotide sulfurtransferase
MYMKTNKLQKLNSVLKSYRRVLIAYSGGVDSTFLLAFAKQVLGKDNVLAVTAVSETYTADELKNAKRFGKLIGAEHVYIKTSELKDAKFRSNPLNRCFYCKLELFKKLSAMARKNGMVLCDATNYSDRSDFRPGRIAAKKLKVKSPLLEAKITKDELRVFSRAMKLPNWNAPAQACLASRFPYGTGITENILRRIEKGELYLKKAGFTSSRLRHHDDIARIEVPKNEIGRFLSIDTGRLAAHLKKLGWRYVTIDIEGYRNGSMNP